VGALLEPWRCVASLIGDVSFFSDQVFVIGDGVLCILWLCTTRRAHNVALEKDKEEEREKKEREKDEVATLPTILAISSTDCVR